MFSVQMRNDKMCSKLEDFVVWHLLGSIPSRAVTLQVPFMAKAKERHFLLLVRKRNIWLHVQTWVAVLTWTSLPLSYFAHTVCVPPPVWPVICQTCEWCKIQSILHGVISFVRPIHAPDKWRPVPTVQKGKLPSSHNKTFSERYVCLFTRWQWMNSGNEQWPEWLETLPLKVCCWQSTAVGSISNVRLEDVPVCL